MADTLSWSSKADLNPTTLPLTSMPPSPSLTFATQPVSSASSITLLLSLPDLIYYTSYFLTIDELLCCSALSSRLHTFFDSDKVWRRRLGEAKHIQSSWVPLEIQRPYVHRDDEEDDEEKHESEEEEKHSLRREEEQLATAQALLLEQSRRGAFEPSASSPPPLSLALALCRFYYIYRINSNNHLNCDVLPLAILPVPHSINLNTFAPPPAAGVCVYHCRFLLTRDRLVNKSDARELRLAWDEESGQWQVAAMLRSDSGILALNVHNVRDGRIIVPDEPLPATLSCKQRYIRLLACSCHSTTNCHRLLPPSPALPPPRPVPAWFSHHLAQLSIRQQPFPPIPPSAYPSFHPLPVCGGCRLEVKDAVRVFSELWREREGVLGFEVDCVVRVNEREWDVRWRAYADDVTYRRCVLVAEDGENGDDEEEDEDEWRLREDEDDEQLAEEQRAQGMADTLAAAAQRVAAMQRLAEAAERQANEGNDDEEGKQEAKVDQEPAHVDANTDTHEQQPAARQRTGDVMDEEEEEDGEDEEDEDTDEWVENDTQPTDATLQWIYGQLADATTQHYQRLREEAEAGEEQEQQGEGEEEKGQQHEGPMQEEEEVNEEATEEDVTTPRPTIRPRTNSLPMSDATASSVAASTAATLASSSVSSPSSTASTSARHPLFRVDRVLMDNDSGVYAINAPSNLPWTDLAPRSSLLTHPAVLFMHDHPLYHHTRSVYRNAEYVCDVCHELHDSSNGGVWHCDHCSYDCCEAKVEEARREQQAAMELIEAAKRTSHSYTAVATSSGGLSMD